MKANLKIVAGVAASLLLAGNASAAVLTAAADNYSKEGVTTTGNVTLPTITAVLAADYSVEDRIAVTITGASVVSASDLTASMTCPGLEGNGLIVGFLNRSGNTLNFRVTQTDVANNLGATCFISGIQVTKASLASSTEVVATYAARTLNDEVIDTGCADAGSPGTLKSCTAPDPDIIPNRAVLATVQSQFNAKIYSGSDLDGVIDVEQDRTRFVDGDDDWLTIEVTNKTGLLQAVTANSAKYVISGNFGFAAGDDGKCNTADDEVDLYTDIGTGIVFNEACNAITVTYNAAAFPAPSVGAPATVLYDYIEIDLDGDGKLSPQSFPSTYTFGWPTDKTAAFNFSAGAWTINGALVFVPYMPYGDNISQIIYVANRGSQVGEISVDAFDESGASYSFDVGTVAGGTVRKLTQAIIEGLTTAGFGGTGRVAFEITVTAPADDIDVYSAYNVGGSDRGTVVNSQNGRAKTCDNDCYYWD